MLSKNITKYAWSGISQTGPLMRRLFSTGALKFYFDLYLAEDQAKRFYVNSNSTLADVEALIQQEQKVHSPINFKDGEDLIENKNATLLSAILNCDFKIEYERKKHVVTMDLNSAAAYNNGSYLDQFFLTREIPINDAALVAKFVDIMQGHLEKRNPGKRVYQPKEISDTIEETLKIFNDKLIPRLDQEERLLQLVQQHLSSYSDIKLKIEQKALKQSQNVIKYLLIALIIQWIVLFYMCYYLYGWDLVEPIAYLLSLSAESLGILFYLRMSKNLQQRALFKMFYDKYYRKMAPNLSTDPVTEFKFLLEKSKFVKRRMLYLNPSKF